MTGNHTIAIVDAYNDPNIYGDLKQYQETFHVSDVPQVHDRRTQTNCLLVLNQSGDGRRRSRRADPGWATEIALDVEIARAICQNCRIELFEAEHRRASTTSRSAVNTAADRGAEVISNSYGAYLLRLHRPCARTTIPHVAITVSAGDSGYGVACPAQPEHGRRPWAGRASP